MLCEGDEKAKETGVRRLPPFHVRDKRHEEEKYGRMIFLSETLYVMTCIPDPPSNLQKDLEKL